MKTVKFARVKRIVALAAAALAMGIVLPASAGSCIISGSTERSCDAHIDKSCSGTLDSTWRDFSYMTFLTRFYIRPIGGLILTIR